MIRLLSLLFGTLLLTTSPAFAQDSERRGQMAINLAGVTDWSPQQPFLDVFKTARPWIGHRKRGWGGATYEELRSAGYLDAEGWPVAIPPELGSIGTLILTHLPEDAIDTAGHYRLQFEGNGIVEVSGRAQNVRYGKNEVTFDFTPGEGFVEIRIQRTDRARTGDHVRNITVVKQDNIPAFESGQIFNPIWLERLDGFVTLRFMDWMQTNHSRQQLWRGRPRPTDFSWAIEGVPVEIMTLLANRLNADPWFTLPHLADDDYARRFATLVRDRLDPGRKSYLEFSNEVWNWQFHQAGWANEQAFARWNADGTWMQFYAARAIEIAAIWTDVFGPAAPDRLVRVLSTQTGWLGLEEQVLEARLWRAEDSDHPRPADLFDAYAIAAYFGRPLGLEENADMVRGWIANSRQSATAQADQQGLIGGARDQFITDHQYDEATAQAWGELLDGISSGNPQESIADVINRQLPYHAEVARKNGLDLIIYEGGTHIVGVGPMVEDADLTAFFAHLNYTAEMGLLYEELLAAWKTQSTGVFSVFNDVTTPSKWGSWGALRHLSDSSPRWDAIEAAK